MFGRRFLALAICLAMLLNVSAVSKPVKADSYGVSIVGEEVHVVFPNTCYIFYKGETHWELKDCADTFHFELPARKDKQPFILVDTEVAGRVRFGEYKDSLTVTISEDPVEGDHDQDPIHFLLHRVEEEKNQYDTCEDWSVALRTTQPSFNTDLGTKEFGDYPLDSWTSLVVGDDYSPAQHWLNDTTILLLTVPETGPALQVLNATPRNGLRICYLEEQPTWVQWWAFVGYNMDVEEIKSLQLSAGIEFYKTLGFEPGEGGLAEPITPGNSYELRHYACNHNTNLFELELVEWVSPQPVVNDLENKTVYSLFEDPNGENTCRFEEPLQLPPG
ncbi:MAG: hypothetical protein DRO11_09445, partial [Methanobacteriota archaeon]